MRARGLVAPFVVVDLEGTAAKITLLANSRADLVLIPTQGSQLDAAQASRAIAVVRQAEKVTNRPIPYRILLTRTNPVVRTRTLAHVHRAFRDAGVPVLKTELHEREAYRAMFSFRERLDALPPSEVANLDKAIANAADLVIEIIDILRAAKTQPRPHPSSPPDADRGNL